MITQDAMMNDETTIILRKVTNESVTIQSGFFQRILSKRCFDIVRSRKAPNSSNMLIPEGKVVVGLEGSDGSILVRVHGIHDHPLRRVRASTLERVTHGFAAGD